MQDFQIAAERHYRDADLLEASGRLPNADHLAGLAVECALKEMLLQYLGSQQTTKGKPVSVINGTKQEHGHLPRLWSEVGMVIAGRAVSSALAGIVLGPNPFASWSINDRYDDGHALTAPAVAGRIEVARQVLGHLQIAKAIGSLS